MKLCEAVRPVFWKDVQANRANWLGRLGRNISGEHLIPNPRYVIRAPIVAFVVGTQKRKIITLGADVGRPETGEFKPETSQVCYSGAGWCQFFLPLLLGKFRVLLCKFQCFN